MTKQKRKPGKSLRVPFACTIAPATKELITGIQNETKESQGEVVDRAVALLALGEEVKPRAAKKQNRREKAIAERAAGDVIAQRVGREDIDYSDVESTPTVNVANLRGTAEAVSEATSKAVEKWRANRKPLLKPKEQ